MIQSTVTRILMASTSHSNWRGFKIEKTGQWPEMADVHIKGKISESPGSCIFPYMYVCLVVQAPLPMGFPRQEYWGGLSFSSPGDLLEPGIEPGFPASRVDSLPLSHQGNQ